MRTKNTVLDFSVFGAGYLLLPILQRVIKYYQIIFFSYFMLQVQCVAADEIVPLKIILNTQDKGEYFVIIRPNQDVLINEVDFNSLGIKTTVFSIDINGEKYVSLNDLSDKLDYSIDDKSLSLLININPELLEKTVVDLSQKTVVRSNPFGIDSAFLNYSFINHGSDKQVLQLFETPIEGVISAHDMLLQLNFTHRREYTNGILTEAFWSRGLTNITKDFPQKLNRLIIGDVAANSGETGGSGVFLGFSYRKKYSIATYFTKYPSVSVNGVLRTPSRVNMYANGVLIRSEMLPPGEFRINNLPNLYGAGNLEMETIDAFGRVSRQDIPYYVSTKLLKVGLNDFMYTVGFKRDSIIAPQAKYDPNPSILGYHRYGLFRYLTVGYRFEFTSRLKNVGSSANILLGSLGEAEAGLSVSHNQESTGTERYFRYGFTSRYIHGRYAFRQRSVNYNTISNVGGFNLHINPQQSVGVGVHGLVVGSLALNYDVVGSFSNPIEKDYSLIYTVRIAKQTSLIARATRKIDINGESTDAFVVSINSALGRNVSVNVTHTEEEMENRNSAYIQKSLPIGTGIGGRVRIDQLQPDTGGETYLGAGSLKLNTKILSANADYTMGEQENSFVTQFAGALAFIDNDFYMSLPIQDSFGLAKVGDLDDVKVYYGSELIGKTDDGKLILPYLVSYADNHISIDGQDVPVDRALKNTSRRLSPKFRTGSVALFDVEKFQGFFGYIYIEKNNIRKTADYASLTLQKGNQVFDTVVGKGGEFYLENLESGTYRAETKLDGERCRFRIKVTASKEMMVELGDYVCKI